MVLLCILHLHSVTVGLSVSVLLCTLHPHFVTVGAACLPIEPINGNIQYSTGRIHGEYLEGTTATIFCEPNHFPTGPSSITCQGNQWSDSLVCRGENMKIIF